MPIFAPKKQNMAIKSKIDLMIEGWKVKDEVFLDDEDKAIFSSAKVVSSDFGKLVCFFLKGHGQQYIPFSYEGEQLAVGDTVSLDAISIQIWGKEGEKDIMRAKINKME